MLIVLKIPVVYLCAVVWWAIKAEPLPLEGAGIVAPLEPSLGPVPECDWQARRTHVLRRGPLPRGGGRAGRPGRVAHARARANES
jgi:hypothetical protein